MDRKVHPLEQCGLLKENIKSRLKMGTDGMQ
jgi:hypothetical protein